MRSIGLLVLMAASLAATPAVAQVKFTGRTLLKSSTAMDGSPLAYPKTDSAEITSMLMEIVKGRKADEIAALPKEELLEEIGIPLTPIRLKCALLGLGVLKVALHRAKGTALPDEWAGLDELELK